MLATIIALAFVGQTPTPAPAPRPQVQQQTVAPATRTQYQTGIAAQVAKNRAKKTAQNIARGTRARAAAEAEHKGVAKTAWRSLRFGEGDHLRRRWAPNEVREADDDGRDEAVRAGGCSAGGGGDLRIC
jgi:hypothetical protein